MIGIAEGTIKPREYTPEESAAQEKATELRAWSSKSKNSILNEDGSPKPYYVTDGAEGTFKLGQTLSATGDEADAHFVRVTNPLELRTEDSLQSYIEKAGGETEAKAKLQTAGYDGITYGDGTDKKVITFNDDQYRPVQKYEGAANVWNKEHVYFATDKKYSDQILNAGIKSPRAKEAQYFATPEEALKNAVQPASGNPKDLNVYSVPRAEVEKGVHEYEASKEKRDPDYSTKIGDDALVTDKSHMPGHLLELGDDGKFTGRSTPLRPFDAEDLPGDNSRFNNSYTADEKDQYIEGLRKALDLTEDQKEVAKTLRNIYDNSFMMAKSHGLIRQWVEAYHPQAWAGQESGMWRWLFNKNAEPVVNNALNELRHDTNTGNFDTNLNAAKHRVYNTEFQGIMAGEKFKTDDLSMHVFNHVKAIQNAIAARNFIDSLRSKGTKAQDGRPAAVLAGTSRKIGGDENPALATDPGAVKAINIKPELVEAMQQGINPKTGMSELEFGLKNGTIEKLPWTIEVERDGKVQKVPAYAYTSEGYESIDHPALREWGYSGQDTAGKPALLYGDIMVHPDFAEHVRQAIGVQKSIFRESPTLSAIGTVSGEAKGLLLSLSPFHVIQEGLRAAMMGINPFKADHININENPTLQAGVKAGLVRNDYHAKDQFSTGYASHSKLISAVPGLKQFQGWMQEFLFEKYIPSLKDRAYLSMLDKIRDANPKLSLDEAASRTADTVNDVFGGQNWRKLGISTASQDFMRMTALAPDWLLSELRMLGRASGVIGEDTTNHYAKMQMAKQMGAVWLGARVMNMLVSGNMHAEAPFGVVSKNDKGEETVYSIRTLPTDLIHVMSQPREFMAGRVNPLTVRPVIEGLTGRDSYGRRVTAGTQVADAFHNFLPIAGQNLLKGSSDLTNTDQLYKATGGSIYKYRTEAEKLAQQYASDRMPTGPVSEKNLKAHQEDIQLEDALRKGEIGRASLVAKTSKRRADEIIRYASLTPLQARFDRLPLSEAINVFDAATKTEKDQLSSALWKKRVAYMKQNNAAKRNDDATRRKLQSVYADLR